MECEYRMGFMMRNVDSNDNMKMKKKDEKRLKVRKKEDILKPEHMNAIYYGDCESPKSILGYHEVEDGGLFCYWNPLATSIWLRHRKSGKTYKMEAIKEGFFIYVMKHSLRKQNVAKDYHFEVLLKESETKEIVENPYFFEGQIREQDCIAFEKGEHFSIQTILGAHETKNQVKEERITGVRFAVYAPHAKRVSVLGDWNQFHPLMHPMERLGDSGIFELWIPEAKPNMQYEFEIKTGMGEVIRCSDPYRTACVKKKRGIGMIEEENSYLWKDDVYMNKRREESQSKLSPIFYHFDPQLYQKSGKKRNRVMTYRQITKEVLSHVKEIGYTHVLIKGLLEHDNESGEKEEGSVVAYFAPSSLYGTPSDFKYFVNALHKQGIGVYLEWDISGFSNRKDGLAYFDGQALYEYENPLLGVHVDGERHRFCYEKGQVRSFLLSNLFYWIKEYHIDGFSINGVASMLYQDYGRIGGEWKRNSYGEKENLEAITFLQKMNEYVKKEEPSICLIAQDNSGWSGLTKEKEIGGLGFHKAWNQNWVRDYLSYVKYYPQYRQYDFWKMQYQAIKHFKEASVLSTSLTDTPLENTTLIQKVPGEYFHRFAHLRLLYGYMFSYLGDKALFMGEDMAYWSPLVRTKGIDLTRMEDPIHKSFQTYMKDLIAFYKERICSCEIEKEQEGICWLHTDEAEEGIFSFVRKNEKETLLFFFHLKREAKLHYELKLPSKEKYELVFHSDRPEYGGMGNDISGIIKEEKIEDGCLIVDLSPISFLVFSTKIHESYIGCPCKG